MRAWEHHPTGCMTSLASRASLLQSRRRLQPFSGKDGKISFRGSREGSHQASAAAQKIDSIPYELVKPASNRNSYELRLYQPRFIVEMSYKSRATAYMEFDRYLTGENEDSIHLETLSPVIMRHNSDQGTKVMQMFVRRLGALSQDALDLTQQPPEPQRDNLGLNIAGGEVVAVLSFGGQATREATCRAAENLRQLLKEDDVELGESEKAGAFSLAQYDPVHSLKERTNELWLAVSL